MPTPKPARVLEPTRARFRSLLAANPNYFGTAPGFISRSSPRRSSRPPTSS